MRSIITEIMITKQIAGLLYSYGYDLVREGTGQILSIKGVYEVGDTLKMDLHYNGKHWASEPVSKIGKEFFILAREMDLTKPIQGVGVPIVELCKQEYGSIYYPDDYDECNLSDLELHIIALSKNFCTLSYRISLWLYTHHFNLDFPEGTTINLI